MSRRLSSLLVEVRACRLCADELPLGPRPVLRVSPSARVLIIGQAPGTKVHETGIPFNDPSGDRLRDWLGIDRDTFYDVSRIAIMPMGLCYPGRLPRGGDRPPAPRCAPTWHDLVLAELPSIELTLLVGRYAQVRYLPVKHRTVTDTVRDWRAWLPRHLPLPHPSWRTTAWERRNSWFTDEVLPELRRRVAALIRPPVSRD